MENFKSLLKKKYLDKKRLETVNLFLIGLDDIIRKLMVEKNIKQPVNQQTYTLLFNEVMDYMTGNAPEHRNEVYQNIEDILDTLLTLVKEFYYPNYKVNNIEELEKIIQKSGEVLYKEFYLCPVDTNSLMKKGNAVDPNILLKKGNKSKVEVGNTSGNIYNGGFFAYKDNCKYSAVAIDGVLGIYKERVGQKPQRIYSGEVNKLNVVGDWVYFHKIGSIFGGIAKVKTDGTSYTDIVSGGAVYMFVVGEWIYYVNSVKKGLFSSDSDIYLYKVKTDGTNKTTLTKMTNYNYAVYEDHIYYTKGNDILRMKNDGTELTKVVEGTQDGYLSNISISDDSIYTSKNFGEIDRYDIKTKKKFSVHKSSFYRMNVSNNWIYYVNNEDNYLYRVSTDGDKKEKLVGLVNNNDGIYVVGREVIYSKDNTYHSYRI